MENRFFITICSDRFSEEILLETEGNLAISELLKDILKLLNWPIEVDNKPVKYHLRFEDRELDQTETLISAGVINFETIWITPDEKENIGIDKIKEKATEKMAQTLSAPLPYWLLIPVEQPSLIHPDGYQFVLDKPPILIGRHGGEMPVQIDLSEFEKDRFISSRRHAEIIIDNGKYCLRAFSTRNGTFIGRDELAPGEFRPLKNNDVIQFGSGGVRLIFRTPEGN